MPTTLHGLLEVMLALMLQKQGLQAASEVTVRVAEKKFLIPDVVAAQVLQRPFPTEPVLLCVEIISPEDHIGSMLAKCEQYHDWGVPYCWVIDPEKQTARHYHKDADPERINRSGILTAGQFSVRLEELFSETK